MRGMTVGGLGQFPSMVQFTCVLCNNKPVTDSYDLIGRESLHLVFELHCKNSEKRSICTASNDSCGGGLGTSLVEMGMHNCLRNNDIFYYGLNEMLQSDWSIAGSINHLYHL